MWTDRRASRVVWCQAVGFEAIIALSWAHELADVPGAVFGATHRGEWREGVLEAAIVLIVAAPALAVTRRGGARVRALEAMVRMCAWCRRVERGGVWEPVEEYLWVEYDARTTHGMCPACLARATAGGGGPGEFG